MTDFITMAMNTPIKFTVQLISHSTAIIECHQLPRPDLAEMSVGDVRSRRREPNVRAIIEGTFRFGRAITTNNSLYGTDG